MTHSIRTRALRLAMTFALLLHLTPLAAAEAPHDGALDDPPPTGAGDLLAHRKDGTVLGACPLKHTDVATEIAGFVARVVVTQTFANPFTDPIEAVYTFPLSDRAAVDGMTMKTGTRVIRGEIKRREEARRIYETARAAGQLTSLLDQERPNIFTQSLANVMPGAEVEVRLEYVEPLKFADGTFEFSFPTVVGPRFIPGNPTGHAGTGWAPDTDRVPDASRLTPPAVPSETVTPEGTRAGHDLSIAVDLDAGVPLGAVVSPLHPITVDRPTPERARIALVNQREIPNRDFVLRYTVATDTLQSTALTHRGADGADGAIGDGYLTVVLLPPKRTTAESAAPKELVFVIDRSGSQAGAPLDKAKETMRWIIDHLNPRDTFQIVDFGSDANVLFTKPERVTAATRKRARDHIDALEANGGTMMAEAVQRVTAMPADEHRLRIVTFMTDGYVGNDFEVLDLVRKSRGTARWFPFGTGNSVNRYLIETMARLGGGEPDFVLLADPGETVARRFYRRIASPVLTDVHIAFEGLDVTEVEPRALSDVWDERPLVIHARYRKAGRGSVVLRGFQGGLPYEQRLAVTLPEREEAHAAIASLWARARVDAIMDEDLAAVQSGQVPDERRERIVTLALAHRLLTQFTSFVAVEEKIVNEGGRQRTVAVPVEMPDGVEYEGVFGAETAAAAPAQALAPRMAGGFANLLGAPAAMEKHARVERGDSLRRQAPAALPSRDAAKESDALVDAPPPPPSPRAQTRLAPELLALATAAPPETQQIRVLVTLRLLGDRERQALIAAGLVIEKTDGSTVVGSIAVARLVALAEVDGVEHVVRSNDGTAATFPLPAAGR